MWAGPVKLPYVCVFTLCLTPPVYAIAKGGAIWYTYEYGENVPSSLPDTDHEQITPKSQLFSLLNRLIETLLNFLSLEPKLPLTNAISALT